VTDDRLVRRELAPVLKTVAVTLALIAISVAIKLFVSSVTGANAGFLFYVPAVAIAAWYRGFLGGIC